MSVDVQEGHDEVVITVRTQNGQGGDDCLDSVGVDLAEPLGDRLLVDASSGDEVPLSPAVE